MIERVSRRRALALGAASLVTAPAIVRAQGQNGVALVIGNSKYQWEASLPNVKRDAPDMVAAFQGLGLKTELVQDAGRDAMRQAIDRFGAAARGANLAAFYFAGHGAQWGRKSYLVPVDTDLSSPNVVDRLVPARATTDAATAAAHKLLVTDSCRNNPADGWRQQEAQDWAGGYDPSADAADLPADTLLLSSTAPGRIALDGPPGQNSPFAAMLLGQLETGSVDFWMLPSQLRRSLLIATEGRQVLFDRNSYRQSFVLRSDGRQRPPSGPRSSWSSDPSRIVELRNAYAYASQNRLFLPAGLVAHRSAGAVRDARKIGAYSYLGFSKEPSLLIVMSVEEQQAAEIVIATRDMQGKVGWRFLRGVSTGDRVDVTTRANGAQLSFGWSDQSGGRVTTQVPGRGSSSQPFTRLDG